MQQIGRYRVVGELGRGAMGLVYKAQDPAIGRTVAIKTIRLSDLTDEDERSRLRDRLFREAQSAGILSHPNIVVIYDVLEQDGLAYVFMEFVDGPALERMLSGPEPLTGASALSILRQTAQGLDYAHGKGIIHRDIKPSNILVRVDGTAKITDFGVAKIVSQQMTAAGAMMGTPSYMSPEQVQGQPIDGCADQWALAVIAYEVLTGERPFAGEYLPTLLYKICREDPPPVRPLNPALAAEVDAVLRKALSKAPADRFKNCGAFLDALSGALDRSPGWHPLIRGASSTMETIAAPPDKPVAKPRPTLPAPPPHLRRPPHVEPAPESEPSPVARKKRVRLFPFVLGAMALAAAVIAFVLFQQRGGEQQRDQQAAATQPPAETTQAVPAPEKPSPVVTDQKDETKPTETPEQPAEQTTGEPKPGPPVPPSAPKPQQEASTSSREPVLAQLTTNPPGARITVDNNPTLACTTPCSLALEPGKHLARVTLGGYRAASRSFETPRETQISIPLDQSLGVLNVTSNPPGAVILINGSPRPERTPAVLRLPPGLYRLQVRLNGTQTDEETVEIRDGGIAQRRYSLE